MPIVKCEASKATPSKGIAYIMDPEKVIARGSQGFMSDDPEKMARQMLQTMQLFGKGYNYNERKYYHVKVAFHPKDRPENGGVLTPERANHYAARYARKLWPGREVAWAVQDHGRSVHIHFIVAACDLTTGRKLDARDAEYRGWKDHANVLAAEYGFSTLDWRKATAEKRAHEKQQEEAVNATFAEVAMHHKEKYIWKDELRSIIDHAAATCRSMQEFQKVLQKRGVILTRCSEKIISYQLHNHKACRGDTLGGDYTVHAIRDAIMRNAYTQNNASLGEIDSSSREKYRKWGRLAGMKREEVDELCDKLQYATWEEKQRLWEEYKNARNLFWEDYQKRRDNIQQKLDMAYQMRRKVRNAEWLLSSENRRKSLGGVIVAGFLLHQFGGSEQYDLYIEDLKRRGEKLRKEAQELKKQSNYTVSVLKTKNLSLDEYTDALNVMQTIAEDVYIAGLSALEYWAQRYNGLINRGASVNEAFEQMLKGAKHRAEQENRLYQVVPVEWMK